MIQATKVSTDPLYQLRDESGFSFNYGKLAERTESLGTTKPQQLENLQKGLSPDGSKAWGNQRHDQSRGQHEVFSVSDSVRHKIASLGPEAWGPGGKGDKVLITAVLATLKERNDQYHARGKGGKKIPLEVFQVVTVHHKDSAGRFNPHAHVFTAPKGYDRMTNRMRAINFYPERKQQQLWSLKFDFRLMQEFQREFGVRCRYHPTKGVQVAGVKFQKGYRTERQRQLDERKKARGKTTTSPKYDRKVYQETNRENKRQQPQLTREEILKQAAEREKARAEDWEKVANEFRMRQRASAIQLLKDSPSMALVLVKEVTKSLGARLTCLFQEGKSRAAVKRAVKEIQKLGFEQVPGQLNLFATVHGLKNGADPQLVQDRVNKIYARPSVYGLRMKGDRLQSFGRGPKREQERER